MSAYDDDTAAALRLWVILSRAQRAVGERVRRHVEANGLHLSEFAVLEVLYHRGPLTLGEVGERVLLTSGSMTHVADKLERRGLIVRRPSEHDRRAQRLELTAEGRARVAALFPEHAGVIREAMAGLSTEEKHTAATLLRRLGLHARDAA